VAGGIRIVTDSTSDINAELAKKLDVTVVPLNVRFGNENFKDRIDLDSRKFFQLLEAADELPTTSLPSPGDVQAVYEELVKKYDSIISIHISSKMSGTFQSARAASFEFPDRDIVVIDSEYVASALMIIVVRAAREVKKGADRDSVLGRIKEDISKMDIFFVVDSLDYLQRGGRMGLTSHVIGSLLNVKPILTVRDGVIDTKSKVRSLKKAFRKVVELIEEKHEKPELAVISHGRAMDESKELEKMLRSDYPDLEVLGSEIGPVIGTHTGPGCIEIAIV